MDKTKPRIPQYMKDRLIRYAEGCLCVAILIFTIKAVSFIERDYPPAADYLIIYSLFAVVCLLQAFAARRSDRLSVIKNLCFATVYLVSGIAVVIVGVNNTAGAVLLLVSFLSVILANRIIAVITGDEWSYKLIDILISIGIIVLMIAALCIEEESRRKFLMGYAVLVSFKALYNIIILSFSHMRLRVLRKIVRKTFAAEILFGLALLIASFSYVFMVMETDIHTYFDAIWYCFSVVTTIGFGDVTVTSPYTRALSIILGIYGIIVVALITSIIVNFYNEVKNENKDDPEEKATDKKLPEKTDK